MRVSTTCMVSVISLGASSCDSGWFDRSGRHAQPPQQGLIAHWKLDEPRGTRVADSSTNGIDGELVGASLWHPTNGRFLGALELDGSTYVTFDDAAHSAINDQMTIAAWARTTAGIMAVVPLMSTGEGGWGLSLDAAASTLTFSCAGDDGATANVAIADGQWHHVAGVHNGRMLLLYVDGALVASSSASSPPSSGQIPMHMGATPNAKSPASFAGFLDDVLLYGRALSAAELAAVAADQSPPEPDKEQPALQVRTLMLRGSVSDKTEVAGLEIDGNAVELANDGTWEAEIHVTQPNHTLTLTAVDTLGNESITTIQIDL